MENCLRVPTIVITFRAIVLVKIMTEVEQISCVVWLLVSRRNIQVDLIPLQAEVEVLSLVPKNKLIQYSLSRSSEGISKFIGG